MERAVSNVISVVCINPVQAHQIIQVQLWPLVKALTVAGHRLVVTAKPETRSTAQNARLWAMLTEISQQVDWYGRKLSPEDWKNVFSSALRKLEVVPNLDGTGFVALGQSTSRMTRAEMCDMQTLMESFGAEKGVKFKAQIDDETGEIYNH